MLYLLNDVVFYFFIAGIGFIALVCLGVIFVYAFPVIFLGLFIYLCISGEYLLVLLLIGLIFAYFHLMDRYKENLPHGLKRKRKRYFKKV